MRKVLFRHGADNSHRLAVSELGLRDHVHYPDYEPGKEDPMEPVNAPFLSVEVPRSAPRVRQRRLTGLGEPLLDRCR